MLTAVFTVLGVSMIVISANCQQCRYVTVPVCDEQSESSPGGNVAVKGEKGDRGFSGKLGPKGEVGRKGEVGEKGSKGNAAEIEELQQHLSDRIDGRRWIVGLCVAASFTSHQQTFEAKRNVF